MSRQDRERELERALASAGAGEPDTEAGRLAALAGRLRRLGASTPPIDERRVWLRVQAGMLAEPQRPSRLPRLSLPRLAMLVALTPKPVLGGAVALALLLAALVTAVLLQPRESASAAFLDEIEGMAQASGAAANRGTLSAQESVALEQRALGLLELASMPEVLSGLRRSEADLAYQRLLEARSALAAVVGENPGDTRALAALAAISGLLDAPEATDAARGATPGQQDPPPTVEAAAATPSVEPTSTATVTATATAMATAVATSQGQGAEAPRTPPSTPESDGSSGRGAAPAAAPASTANAGSAVSAAQIACARVYDAASLSACTSAAATASAACAQARGANGCQAAIEAALSGAQQRVQRVGEDCQRLPSSRAREACSEATNKSRSNSGRGNENSNGRGGGQRNESDSRDRRD